MIELPVIDPKFVPEEKPRDRFWRSIQQLRGDSGSQAEGEFADGAVDPPTGSSRRTFIQLMGASMALAGLTGCRRPEEKIVPFSRKPEDTIPAVPRYYATSIPFRGVLRGLLVESNDGRPTKIEGNPEHPTMLGASSHFEQASILNLYDPDRSQTVLEGGARRTPADLLNVIRGMAATSRVLVIAEPAASPTRDVLRRRLQTRFPALTWVEYAPEGYDPAERGLQLIAGRPLRPICDFSKASVIVSLDADFLGPTDRNMIRNTREFAAARRVKQPTDTPVRLYVAESCYTITGGKADHRLRVRSSDVGLLAEAIAARLGLGTTRTGNPFTQNAAVAALVQDLQGAAGGAVLLAGDAQPPEVHALCAAINARLGSGVVRYLDTGVQALPDMNTTMQNAVAGMSRGQFDAVVFLGTNPAYSLPASLRFAAAVKRVPLRIHHGLHLDETAALCNWHVPATHPLETWGDGRAYDGTLTAMQPLIAPLYPAARSEAELLNMLATGAEVNAYDLVRAAWQEAGVAGGDFEQGWRRALHLGYVPDTAYAAGAVGGGAVPVVPVAGGAANDIELVFRLDPTVLDGGYANNAWCQELPDPVTKIVWDNVALMSPATAERLGVETDYSEGHFNSDTIEIGVGETRLSLPIWILQGHADNSITLLTGYGRQIRTLRPERKKVFFDTAYDTDVYAQGAVATGVGANVWPARGGIGEAIVLKPAIKKLEDTYQVVTTQEHFSMEGRPIIRETTLTEFRKNPKILDQMVEPDEVEPLWHRRDPYGEQDHKDHLYQVNQWGMVIDMNACTGCSACVVACQSENSIPVVGREEVGRGREMHWLRIDRYFVGDEVESDNPKMSFQPMMCVHCEYAPCEPVCPVNATSHSTDGINEMTYNRCVGTRYCANNCPYKVRRFNFYNWTNTTPLTVQMGHNPNVTVRFRGVMEKCTYCVQRVREGQRRANLENRLLADGEVQTACQQVCPAQAIIFGDLNNPAAEVVRQKQYAHRYEVLEELNTQPRTSYLGVIRNPAPQLQEA